MIELIVDLWYCLFLPLYIIYIVILTFKQQEQ
jgi:hypothetical protein